jgi:hypothetical protein
MNNQFNINRLILLFKRFFNENAQKELTFWGISTIVMMLLHEQNASVIMFLIISGFIFAARQFKMFAYTPSGMHFLMIPATHFEKLTVSIILSTVYFFFAFIISYIVGTFLGTHLMNFILDRNEVVQFGLLNFTNSYDALPGIVKNYANDTIFRTFGIFAIIQSIFLFGSVYFKRNAVGRTILSMILLSTLLIIIELIMLKTLYGSTSISNNNLVFMNMNFDLTESLVVQTISKILEIGTYLTVPFFWVVSYFRLTEKQV